MVRPIRSADLTGLTYLAFFYFLFMVMFCRHSYFGVTIPGTFIALLMLLSEVHGHVCSVRVSSLNYAVYVPAVWLSQ